MSVHLHRQIGRLKKMMLRFGKAVGKAVDDAFKSFTERDHILARSVVDGDAAIDEMEIDVEEECLHPLTLF